MQGWLLAMLTTWLNKIDFWSCAMTHNVFIDFDTCHPSIKTSFVTFSQIKRLSWDDMHFTCHTKVIDDMEF